jgi:hypothetical protein
MTVPRQALASRHRRHPRQGWEHIVLLPGRLAACQGAAGLAPRFCSPIVEGGFLCLSTPHPVALHFTHTLSLTWCKYNHCEQKCQAVFCVNRNLISKQCPSFLLAKFSFVLAVCWLIRQVLFLPPRKTKFVSKMLKNACERGPGGMVQVVGCLPSTRFWVQTLVPPPKKKRMKNKEWGREIETVSSALQKI